MMIPLFLTFLMVVSGAPRNGVRELIVHVKNAPTAWSEPQLAAKIEILLGRSGSLRVFSDRQRGGTLPAFPSDYYNLDSLLAWGAEAGGDYLMVVDVASERLERAKTFCLPLVFHRYESLAVIEGEWRFVDLKKGKLLFAEPFCVTEKGKQILQTQMDDDINDPAVNLSPTQKMELFDRLEKRLAEQLVKKASKYARGQ